MSDATNGPRRALVLGGGGPVGVAWEVGLAHGLAAGGIDLSTADYVVGTSAGSIAGALLLGGDDLGELVDGVTAMFADSTESTGAAQVPTEALGTFMEMTFEGASLHGDPEGWTGHQKRAGEFALAAETIPEQALVDTIGSVLAGRAWPEQFHCTAVDTATGEFKVWDRSSRVPI